MQTRYMPTRFIYSIILFMLFTSCHQTLSEMVNHADALNNEKNYGEAIKVCTDVIAKNDKIESAYYTRCQSYVALKNYPKALNDINKVIEVQPESQPGLSVTLIMNKDLPGASEEDKGHIDYFVALYLRAQVEYFMDSAKSSYYDFQSCIDNYYQASNCLLWQGTIFMRQSNKDAACKKFNKAREIARSDDDINEADRMLKLYCK